MCVIPLKHSKVSLNTVGFRMLLNRTLTSIQTKYDIYKVVFIENTTVILITTQRHDIRDDLILKALTISLQSLLSQPMNDNHVF